MDISDDDDDFAVHKLQSTKQGSVVCIDSEVLTFLERRGKRASRTSIRQPTNGFQQHYYDDALGGFGRGRGVGYVGCRVGGFGYGKGEGGGEFGFKGVCMRMSSV